MRRTICLILSIIFYSLSSQAQMVVDEEHPRKIADPSDRIVVDFSYDGFTHYPGGITQKPYSLGGNIAFMYDYPVFKGPLSLAFGVGISTHNVHTNGRLQYYVDSAYTYFTPITNKYNTNKLSLNYVEIPLELRIRTRGNNHFKVYVGGKVGYLFNVHTKYEDADGKIKVYKIRNIEHLRYGITFRIGYNKWNLQAFYGLSELFKKGKGEPGMVPFSAGIGLLLF